MHAALEGKEQGTPVYTRAKEFPAFSFPRQKGHLLSDAGASCSLFERQACPPLVGLWADWTMYGLGAAAGCVWVGRKYV